MSRNLEKCWSQIAKSLKSRWSALGFILWEGNQQRSLGTLSIGGQPLLRLPQNAEPRQVDYKNADLHSTKKAADSDPSTHRTVERSSALEYTGRSWVTI